MNPEYALACAVVEKAMQDLTGGCRRVRDRAREDIQRGGLDYWIYQVAGDEDMFRHIKSRLAEVLADCCP